MKSRVSWSVAGQVYAADRVLVISLPAFLGDNRQFEVLFKPGPVRRAAGVLLGDGNLVLSIVDELRPVVEVCTPFASGWSRQQLRGLADIGLVDVWTLDRDPSESDGDLLVKSEDPLTPRSLMLIENDIVCPTVLKQAPKTFTADEVVVTRHEAISIDDERIHYVQTGPAAETGDAPVYMRAIPLCRRHENVDPRSLAHRAPE
ncbi:hypothetical protein ACFIOY_20490 [Bradyrhizobium sp. TZ2]